MPLPRPSMFALQSHINGLCGKKRRTGAADVYEDHSQIQSPEISKTSILAMLIGSKRNRSKRPRSQRNTLKDLDLFVFEELMFSEV